MKTNKCAFSPKPHTRYPKLKTLMFALALITANLAFSQTAVWNGTADTTWYTNNKSANEYTITTAEQLAGLANLVNGADGNGLYDMRGKTIKLGNDIAFNDTANWQSWATTKPKNKWTAIGRSLFSISFAGTFDGNEHVVSGIYINSVGVNHGFFGSSSGDIKNLGIVASYIKGGEKAGGIVGFGSGNISNCHYAGIVSGKYNVGGLIGETFGGKITNSYVTGTVSGLNSVGGLVGKNSSEIINAYSTGAVTGKEYVGGLIGHGFHGSVNNSYSTGKITGTENAGGLIGLMYEVKITNSYSATKPAIGLKKT